jgi:plastocyanin
MENMLQRGAVAMVVAGCVIGGVSVAAAAPGANAVIKTTVATTWDPSTVEITTGEKVTWDFEGSTQPHNVHGVDGPAADPDWPKFETPLPSAGQVSRTFTQPGTYDFKCDAHAGMTGKVMVTGAPVTPTATPTPTPTATPTASPQATVSATPTPTPTAAAGRTTPAPFGSARLDVTAPAISKLKLKAVSHGAKLTFTLSEPAAVTIRVKRGSSTARTVRLAARAGARSVTVRGSKLVRGRYTVEVEARDARGNTAAVQRKSLKVIR